MGIIARQSYKSSIVQLLSKGIGLLSTVFVYTLDLEAYGFAQILLASGILISSLASLGAKSLAIRFFPDFDQDRPTRAAFLTLLLSLITIGLLLSILAYQLLIKNWLIQQSSPYNNFLLYADYAGPILILSGIQLYITLFDFYISNFRRITIQFIATTFWVKISLPVIILLAWKLNWTQDQLLAPLVAMQACSLFILVLYLHRLGELRLNFRAGSYLTAARWKKIRPFLVYSILGSIGNKVAFQIDTVSLGAYVDGSSVGAYQILLFAATLISIPYLSISRISNPILNTAIQQEDFEEVAQLYKRSSALMGFIGMLVFTLVIISLEEGLQFLGKSDNFQAATLVFCLIGLGKLLDLYGSLNSQIIAYSKWFRFNLFLILTLATLNLVFNWLFIAEFRWGLVGAALATLIALSVFNLLKLIFIWIKFRIHPFSNGQLYPIIIGATCILLFQVIRLSPSPLFNIFLQSIITASLFFVFAWRTNYLPEFRALISRILERKN